MVVLERPVGPGGTALPLADQADQLAQTLPEVGAVGARLAGVSGGATLGLCLAIRHPQVVGGLVLHEPLVGALAPELHQQFQRSAAIASGGETEAMTVVRAVMGEDTWSSLDPAAQAGPRRPVRPLAGRDRPVRSVRPERRRPRCASARSPILTTIGTRSAPARWAAAEVLRRWADAELVEVPGAGNAVQLDAPAAFAELITTWQTVSTEGAP